MKKTALTLAPILALLALLIFGVKPLKVVWANPIPNEAMTPSVIKVTSPTESTYSTKNIPLVFTVGEPDTLWNPCAQPRIGRVYYAIDSYTQPNLFVSDGVERTHLNFNVNLSNLSDGGHNVTVFAQVGGLAIINDTLTMSEPWSEITIHFKVDTLKPEISILAANNSNYGKSAQLDFALNEPTSWIGYSLDNQPNNTILGNSTLTGLPDGSHSLVIYANDTAGNMGNSDTFFFNINNPTPTPRTTPIMSNYLLPIILIVIVVVICVSLLVYFKKRKR